MGGRRGAPITDRVVEDHADGVLQTAETQAEAIGRAGRNGHEPVVARVRHRNDEKEPDRLRRV